MQLIKGQGYGGNKSKLYLKLNTKTCQKGTKGKVAKKTTKTNKQKKKQQDKIVTKKQYNKVQGKGKSTNQT